MVCCCTNHPTCPPVKQRQMKGRLRRKKPLSTYYTLLRVTYNTLSANTLKNQLPLSSKQALRDSSGSLKERTEEPLGSLNKVYRAHFAWPTL